MAAHFDLVIRGGTVADGTGSALFDADIGITEGVIAGVAPGLAAGHAEIDARGKLVTPGFVDIHTHYDGQATWDGRMQPSSLHGVTTAIMGNCGVGFAPCRPADHDRLVRLMEGVEDIPFPVLSEGLPWNWESFPSYLDALAARAFDIDLGAQLPHAALRVFVMGERGANREAATPDDIAAMAAIAKQAVTAGALGFSTSRTLNHRTSDGQPTPTLTAAEDELTGIAMALREAGAGVLQVVSDFADPQAEFAMLRRMVEASGRPLSFSLLQSPLQPDGYKDLLKALEDAVACGLPMLAQVAPRPVGVLLGLELTLNPFSFHPAYAPIAKAPFQARLERLRDPGFRAQLLAESPQGPYRGLIANYPNMYPAHGVPDYEPLPSASLHAIAAARGVSAQEGALDHMLGQDGRGMLYVPMLNYAEGSLDPAYAMLVHPHTVPGLSDGGAHVGMICDGSFPTSLLTHWTRDRTRGAKLDVTRAVRMQSHDTAAAVGLHDRGRLQPGLRGDVNVIDYDRLNLHAPEIVYDMPAGGRRLLQRAEGYDATVVAGRITYRNGEATGALPGRLVRGEGRSSFLKKRSKRLLSV